VKPALLLKHKPRFRYVLVRAWAILLAGILIPASVSATPDHGDMAMLLTANLGGRFTTAVHNQEATDPLLILAQSLRRRQQERPADLLLDLGNAFYPGPLSRYSHGSIMMDFLDYLNFSATLISSQDLNIGINNLSFLAKGKNAALLSANIFRNGKPVFAPYFITDIRGKRFAFIGITSSKGFFDIAEKALLDVSLADADAAINDALTALSAENVDFIILLSGLYQADNLALMQRFPMVGLCISGGDTVGDLYSVKANRVDLDSGQTIISLTRGDGFHALTINADRKPAVISLVFEDPAPYPVDDPAYAALVGRLSLWKLRFAREGLETVAADLPEPIDVDSRKIANMLRDRFRAEVSILEPHAIIPRTLYETISYTDILKMVTNDFPLFTYRLSGRELKRILEDPEGLIISGADNGMVQGYPIADQRQYKICSPQSVYEGIAGKLGRDIDSTNTWRTLSDEIRIDLIADRVISRNDFDYLERRFRFLADLSFSNFFDQSEVDRGDEMENPPGKPAESYRKWGLENKAVLTLYNRDHLFELTPYIFYVRQDDDYIRNLLRGTLLYTYNLNPVARPYWKSQVDTVVRPVDDLRPVLIRQTLGAQAETEHITGKMGFGFEKQIRDPAEDLFSGIETIIGIKYDFREYLSYQFGLDTFFAVQSDHFSRHQIRSDISNAFSFKLNSYLSFTVKHTWFYLYSGELKQKYTDSRTLLSLDLATDFKIH
jgi:hypothetical protein